MKRKFFLVAMFFVVAAAGAVIGGTMRGSARGVAPVSPGGLGRGHARNARAQAQVRDFTLTAAPVKWEIEPGLVVDGWGYNGQVPGPTLRATEGDLVRVHLINNLPVPTTIHWHGIDVPANMDGVPGLSQDPVEPGDTFTYEFYATNPGTRMYHSHADTDAQIQLGLFGAFIIDPAQPDPVQYDREFTYILTEKALDMTPAVAMGQGEILHRDAGNGRGGALQDDLFLMNGRAGDAIDPLTIAPGSRIRIRLINLGNLVHAMHLHGHSFKIIATDGNPVPPDAQLIKDTVNIAPGERFDLEVLGTNPGVWMFHCHINNHAANGMTTVLQYDGYSPLAGDSGHGSHGASAPPPIAISSEGVAQPITVDTGHSGHASAATPAAATATPAATPSPTSSAAAPAAAGPGQIVMLDDRFVPNKISVTEGTTVTWTSNGNDLHTTTSYDGLWDSSILQKGQSFSYTFTKAGTYRFYCRQHILNGMTGAITVTPP